MKTAVEWLFLMLNNPNSNQDFANKLLNKAKEMEKQQIMDAYVVANGELIEHSIPRAERYYNETFKKICEHHYITSADWKSQTCSKCSHRINL